MRAKTNLKTLFSLFLALGSLMVFQSEINGQEQDRSIDFPDIPAYLTLKSDLHMHSVLSDGSVWPNIRVQEAQRDGLDLISLTDHLEYQPKAKDIPHSDRNLGYELTRDAAKGSDLIVINGAEITRAMPPGHANAIFVQDANKLKIPDAMEVFKEAKNQGAFVFWNHPHWTAQQPDGIATLGEMHLKLISEGLLHGIEIYNENTYSDEALQIALDYNLTILGNSDIHGLIDWQFKVAEGGHRPITLIFATERSPEAIKEALFQRRTAVWFDNTLVGAAEFLTPLVQESLEVSRHGKKLVERLSIHNHSDASYILENRSEFSLHNQASVFTVPA
ncbi:MAG: Sb-PDE family phosphodiesterase, partial [Bacteroides sp.]|nr:Sb-PDE family phosphodiesterase [Bacteroides sp.]